MENKSLLFDGQFFFLTDKAYFLAQLLLETLINAEKNTRLSFGEVALSDSCHSYLGGSETSTLQ